MLRSWDSEYRYSPNSHCCCCFDSTLQVKIHRYSTQRRLFALQKSQWSAKYRPCPGSRKTKTIHYSFDDFQHAGYIECLPQPQRYAKYFPPFECVFLQVWSFFSGSTYSISFLQWYPHYYCLLRFPFCYYSNHFLWFQQ